MQDVIKGFPDLVTRITNHVVGDDTVVIEVAWTGTFTGEFLGINPTGRSLDLRAVFVIELKKGKIQAIREYYPSGLLNKQLGIS
jgi:predicted ester cyclase